jgi:outer membrane protein assembly factor BamE (lipoprotein component of BamABCDE complex)
VPWKDRQRERELLRHCFSDVDHIAIQWLESHLGLLRSDFPLLRFGRTINKHEAVGYCARDRLESDDAALHKLGLESSFQRDDLIALTAKLDSRGQTVEGEEVEAPAKFLTFARRCFDLLAKRSGTQPCEWNKSGEFGYGIGHCDPSIATRNRARSGTREQKEVTIALKTAEDVDNERLPAKSCKVEMGAAPTCFNRDRLRDPMFHRRVILIRHRFAIFSVISGMALTTGCATSVEQRGNLPSQDKIAEVHPGSTTKDEVIKILGSPSSVSIFNDKSWYYISRRTEQFSFFDPSMVDQQVYVVNFDDQGIVKAVDHKGIEDARAIDPVDRATPAPGRELSFLEQVIGNLGKFNSSAGGTSGGSSTGGHQTGKPDN